MTPHPNPLLREEREFRCSTLLREERELRWFLFSISSPFSRENHYIPFPLPFQGRITIFHYSSPFSRERIKVRVKGRKEVS